MPGCSAHPLLDEQRAAHLDRDHHREQDKGDTHRTVDDGDDDPSDLRDGDGGRVGQTCGLAGRVLHRGAQPLDHHGHPHHHVAADQNPVVHVVAGGDRREHLRNPERQHQDAHHLQHRRQPVHPVVGVIGRGEPAEVDPRPTDGERGEGEADQPGLDVTRRQRVRELRGGDTEGDDKGQVEQQLQRGGHPMRLVRISSRHSTEPVRPDQVVRVASGFGHADIFPRSRLGDRFAPQP